MSLADYALSSVPGELNISVELPLIDLKNELSERAFTGVGISMVILSTFIAWYYNMVVGWALYYFTNSMQSRIISFPYVKY